jgi:hypothetical protein
MIGHNSLRGFPNGAFATSVLEYSRPVISQNRIHSTISWTEPAGPGINTGDGSHFTPWTLMRNGVRRVSGEVGEAEVRAKPGTYFDTATIGGWTVLDGTATIRPQGGAIVIR